MNAIYSNGDLDSLWNHMMSPIEKLSMLNIIARRQRIGKKYIDDKSPRQEITRQNNRERKNIPLEGFVTFGSANPRVLIEFIIVRLIKLNIDTIYEYALHLSSDAAFIFQPRMEFCHSPFFSISSPI